MTEIAGKRERERDRKVGRRVTSGSLRDSEVHHFSSRGADFQAVELNLFNP